MSDLGPPHPSAAPVFMDPPSRIVFHDKAIFTKAILIASTFMAFYVEMGQKTTGVLPS